MGVTLVAALAASRSALRPTNRNNIDDGKLAGEVSGVVAEKIEEVASQGWLVWKIPRIDDAGDLFLAGERK